MTDLDRDDLNRDDLDRKDPDRGLENGTDAESSIDSVWRALVTTALLGTDRRDVPAIAPPVVADVVADAMSPDPARRLLDSVAAVTAARRAAFVAMPPAPGLQRPAPDLRPLVPPVAMTTARAAVAAWPVLEDEWMIGVIERGWRLPPDAVVAGLRRTRTDALRRSRVLVAGGEEATWLVEHVPELGFSGTFDPQAELITELPELTMTPEIAELVGLDAHTFVDRLQGLLMTLELTAPVKKMLVHLIARARPAVLVDTADALSRSDRGIAHTLADLATTRATLHDALAAP